MTQAEATLDYGDPKAKAELEALAAAEGVETKTPDRMGIEPITTLILIGAAAAVANVIIKWWRGRNDDEKPGQIVDLRPGIDPKDVVRSDPDLRFGQLLIIVPTEDGKSVTAEMTTYDPDSDLEELSKLIFTKLTEGVFKTAKEVKDLVESILKDKGKVVVKDGE